MGEKLNISFLVDDTDAWIVPFVKKMVDDLSKGNKCRLYHDYCDVPEGNVLFILGCTSIIPADVLKRNGHNVVIHESDLPKGRGFSPVAWQVLEGMNRIPIVAFEAQEQMDSGMIYLKDCIELDGTELLPEIRRKQAGKTRELVYEIIRQLPDLTGHRQVGEPTYYSRRTRRHDELNAEKTLNENFNHLRVLDNDRYPAWFWHKGEKYILKIFKEAAD